MLLPNKSQLKMECHVTTQLGTGDAITIAEKEALLESIAKLGGWKTSQIHRDPMLGGDLYFYFTKYSLDFDFLLRAMDALADALKLHGFPLVRQKIELIIFDSKEPIRNIER